MKKILLLLLLATPASAQFCPSCIQNSAAPQNAQMNIGTATIRGTITASTVTVTFLNASTATIANFAGSGAALTNLNASQLLSGTMPSGRITGSYTGITGLGTVTAGTWNATPVGTQYGGTGLNWVNVSSGSLPFFVNVGSMSALYPGTPLALLQTNGVGLPPIWTSAPQVSGANIYGLSAGSLLAGSTLPTSVIVTTNSIPNVNGTAVLGNISGNAANITGTLALTQLANGTLASTIVASSITAPSPGVAGGLYGDSSHVLQEKIGTDGRISTVTVLGISLPLSDLQSGTLPGGVTVPAASINSGSLGGQVVASSVAATGVVPGTYGSSAQIPQITITGDGRITSASNFALSGLVNGSGSGVAPKDVIWTSSYQVTAGLLSETGGKVGVSTGNPQATLEVNGTSQFDSTTTLQGPLIVGSTTGIVGQLLISQGVGLAPMWSGAVSVSSASNLTGGLANEVPYQTAPNVTTFTGQPITNGVLFANSGAPGWSNTPTLTGTNFTGVPWSGLVTFPAGCSAGTAVGTIAGSPTCVGAINNVEGGSAGAVPVQTGANTTGFLPGLGNGGLVIGDGTSTIPSTGTLTGTANQVNVANAAGSITLSLPQSINAGASPTFVAQTLTGLSSNTIVGVNGASQTVSVPQLGAGGIIMGTAVGTFPSTGTIAAGTNITVTNAAGSITIAAPAVVGTGSNNTYTGTQTYQTTTTFNAPIIGVAAAWDNINYLLWSSSGGIVADSTATFSFNVEVATWVFHDVQYGTTKKNFVVAASTYTAITWNPTNGFRVWGLKDLMPPTISSYTPIIQDDLIVALSSSDAFGNLYFFDTLNTLPTPMAFYSGGNSTNFSNVAANGQAEPYYNCRVNGAHTMASCDTNSIGAFPFNGRLLQPGPIYSANSFPHKWCFVANNTSGGTATAQLYEAEGSANSTWITINGAPGTLNGSEGITPVNISLPTGYFNACLYLDPAGTGLYIPSLKLPAGVSFVRPGEL